MAIIQKVVNSITCHEKKSIYHAQLKLNPKKGKAFGKLIRN